MGVDWAMCDRCGHGFDAKGGPKVRGRIVYARDWSDDGPVAPPVHEPLSGARVQVTAVPGSPGGSATGKLDRDGAFEVPILAGIAGELEVRVFLEDGDERIVRVISSKDLYGDDPSVVFKAGSEVLNRGDPIEFSFRFPAGHGEGTSEGRDLGLVVVDDPRLLGVCAAYGTLWRGRRQMAELLKRDDPGTKTSCKVWIPELSDKGTRFDSENDRLELQESDCKDESVVLHEYGHWLTLHYVGARERNGFWFLWNKLDGHKPGGLMNYEPAWDEGVPTFFACALRDDSRYVDTERGTAKVHDLSLYENEQGFHSEEFISELMWMIYKETSFALVWKAWASGGAYEVRSPLAFYMNWIAQGLDKSDRLLECFQDRLVNDRVVTSLYDYEEGWTYASAWDEGKKEFDSISALYQRWGSFDDGTEEEYREEFFNYNYVFSPNAVFGDLPNKENLDEKIKLGKAYFVPRRAKLLPDGVTYQIPEASDLETFDDLKRIVIGLVGADPECQRRIQSWVGDLPVGGFAGGLRNAWKVVTAQDPSDPAVAAEVCTGIAEATSLAINRASVTNVTATSISRVVEGLFGGLHHTATRVTWVRANGSQERHVFDWHATLEIDDPEISTPQEFLEGEASARFVEVDGWETWPHVGGQFRAIASLVGGGTPEYTWTVLEGHERVMLSVDPAHPDRCDVVLVAPGALKLGCYARANGAGPLAVTELHANIS